MSAASGYAFEAELLASFRWLGIFAWKLPTSTVNAAGHYVPRGSQPCFDFMSVNAGMAVGIEAKSCATLQPFPLSRVSPQSRAHLLRLSASGGLGYVLINFRSPVNVCFAVSASDFMALAKTSRRKSIPSDAFDGRSFLSVPRFSVSRAGPSKLIWDLRVLFPYTLAQSTFQSPNGEELLPAQEGERMENIVP